MQDVPTYEKIGVMSVPEPPDPGWVRVRVRVRVRVAVQELTVQELSGSP